MSTYVSDDVVDRWKKLLDRFDRDCPIDIGEDREAAISALLSEMCSEPLPYLDDVIAGPFRYKANGDDGIDWRRALPSDGVHCYKCGGKLRMRKERRLAEFDPEDSEGQQIDWMMEQASGDYVNFGIDVETWYCAPCRFIDHEVHII